MNTGNDGPTGYEFNRESTSNPPSITLKFPGLWDISNIGFATQTIKEKKEKKEKTTLMGFKIYRDSFFKVPCGWSQLGGWQITLQKKQPWLLKYIGFPSVRFPTVGSI